MTVQAIYENGVFRPVGPVGLPDHCEVVFEPRVLNGDANIGQSGDNRVRALLREGIETGVHDLAACHNEPPT
jgi:predicted DNA-binding antitoxin AbrB/MazE fold protein